MQGRKTDGNLVRLAAFIVSTWAGVLALRLVRSSGRVFPYFVRLTALRLVDCLQIWLYFAF